MSKRGSSKNNTYGWARAEVVGALINAVFLVALCFTIFVEATERLVMREAIEDAYLLLYVGGVGLLINLLGLCLFHDHGEETLWSVRWSVCWSVGQRTKTTGLS